MLEKKKPDSKMFFKKPLILVFSFLAFFAVVYFLTLTLLNSSFFLSDFKNKTARVAGVLLAVQVIAAPNDPVLAVSTECQEDGAVANLSWPEDIGTQTFEILRNGATLVSGLTGTSYQDTDVADETTYVYQVVAHGTLYDAFSNEETITTLDCGTISSIECHITSINDIQIATHPDSIRISDRNPDFSGTSSIPYANITLVISGTSNVLASTQANANGYWSWHVPENLDYGWNTLTATAYHPENSSVSDSDSLTFKIEEDDEDEEEKKKKTTKTSSILPPEQTVEEQPAETPSQESQAPFSLNLEVNNLSGVVYTGTDLLLTITLTPKNLAEGNASLEYIILDEDKNQIYSEKEDVSWKNQKVWRKNLPISLLFHSGKYTVLVKSVKDNFIITAFQNFTVKEAPLLHVGKTIISFSFLFNLIGWIIFFLMILLIIFLILLLLEYWLFRKSLLEISEYILKDKGYFSKKKGGAE